MKDHKREWLPHLENAVPVKGYGNRLSMYLIALEGWRRGLTVKFFTVDDPDQRLLVRYSLSDGKKEHKFVSSQGDKLTDEAFEICDNKDLTKQVLAKAGVPVPEGKRFEADVPDEEIVRYAASLGFPLVLKPISENAGKGVFANIQDEEALRNALVHVRQELNYLDVIVERFIPGKEFRIFIVGDKVIGAVNRIPANIMGDGINTIEKLIEIKNQERRKNPNLYRNLIEVDEEILTTIRSRGYSLTSVPEKGERLFLRNKSNVSMGGEPVDVTDQLTPELIKIATRASEAIPGLAQCGLDMIVNEETNSGVVIEINTKPMLGLHMFPVVGKARDVVKATVDHYFPETAHLEKSNLYFDFRDVLQFFRSKATTEVTLTPAPEGKTYAKRYIVSGNVQGVGYRNWIRRQALKQNLHGFTRNLKNGKVVVVVAGQDENVVDEFKNTCFQGPEKAKVENVTAYDWDQPVKIGFEIRRPSKSRLLKELEADLQNEKNEKETVKKRLKQLEEKFEKEKKEKKRVERERLKLIREKEEIDQAYRKVLNSRSWRYTQPIRKFFRYIKKASS